MKKRYVEIEIPEESEDNEKDLQSLEKDLQIPLGKLGKEGYHPSDILIDMASRLGKMRIQDIAYDLDINIPTVKKYRKEILSKLGEIQKVIIISQEQKIE